METNMAWVFLAGPYAFKFKKPIRRDFLDFSTLKLRRSNGRDEVHLNRRLAGDVYIGLVPLTVNDAGELELEGDGQAVEWLVKMERLPSDRMLDYLIERDAVEHEEIRTVATKLATFYRNASPEPVSALEYLQRQRNDVCGNGEALCNPRYGLPLDLVHRVIKAQESFLDACGHLLEARVVERHIIEAHGDLRPEHICLLPEPVIFDCLEFNRSFRIIDTADELAFLSMECEALGAPYVEEIVFDTYTEITRDRPPRQLIEYYKCYRAGLRAKLAIWHLKDDGGVKTEKWRKQAISYLELAASHLPLC